MRLATGLAARSSFRDRREEISGSNGVRGRIWGRGGRPSMIVLLRRYYAKSSCVAVQRLPGISGINLQLKRRILSDKAYSFPRVGNPGKKC
jgi:hypothetical protein